MGVIKVDENDPVGELEPSFPFRDVKILHNVDVRDFYDLKEEIGRGKFGTVYRCVEKKTGIVLAAKFVPIAKKQDRINVEREVEIMRTLQHPRLIQIYDSFEIHNVMCVVLELIEGGELFERVIDDDFILTEKACAVFMRQICEGVNFIHFNKIIHLDLKPENILCLTKTGNRIKIIDFGLARKYDPNKKLQVLFGTPEFVAPEVVNFDEITTATDMWSVGVICYVLLSGLSPFMGDNDLQTMTNVTMAQYDFDDEAFDSISADAKDFISKLLVKNKEKRLTATECEDHSWLKRKPPPPMFLEQSKENLKTYVDTIHPSSPCLLNDSISNGALDSEDLVYSAHDNAKHKTTPDKTAPLPPELSAIVTDRKKPLLEEQNIKSNNDINFEKSVGIKLDLDKELSLSCNVIPPTPSPPDEKTKTALTERKENVSRKAVKTDSFKELPRKFSITLSEGSRELPRRSSLTRADKAKNEIKRETFVTFVGPREIKPIDPISAEVKTVVEELTSYIKANIEEPSTLPVLQKSPWNSLPTEHCNGNNGAQSKIPLNPPNIQDNDNSDKSLVFDKSCREVGKVETTGTPVASTEHLKDLSKKTKRDTLPKNEDLHTSLLRPTEYLKLTKKPPEYSSSKSESQAISKSPNVQMLPYTSESTDLHLGHTTRQVSQSSSSIESFKLVDAIDKIGSSTAKPQLFKSTEPSKVGGKTAPEAADIIPSSSYSCQNLLTSLTKEMSYLKQNKFSTTKETCSSSITGHSSRNQGVVGSIKKPVDVNNDSNSSKNRKFEECSNLHKYNHSTAIRHDLTFPRKTLSSRNLEIPSIPKENSPISLFADIKRTRASSVDPVLTGPSIPANNEQPFQSRRFLRSFQFKPESMYRCSSEITNSKYEDFRNKYSNYKELAMGTDKLLRKSTITERMTSSKTSDKNEDAASSRGSTSDSQIPDSSFKQSLSTPQSSTLPSYSLRQKFNFNEQHKDYSNKVDVYRSSKFESSLSTKKTEGDRYGTTVSTKESSNSKLSSAHKSESKSKLSIPEKCPTSPQKSL